MVKVHKDVLDHLGIEHVFLTGQRNVFCALLEISTTEAWRVAIDGEWEEGEGILNIKYKGIYLTWPVYVKKQDRLSHTIELIGDSVKLSALYESIQTLERDENLWNHRREERFDVGAEGSGLLGLRKVEQKVIIAGTELPCMVNDLSFGGMRLTTMDSGEVKKGDTVTALLDFNNPIERLMLKGTVQAVMVKSGASKGGERPVRFAILSVRFQEDPPLAFRQRLGAFAERVV
jgi:hypothetical protein